MTKIKFHCTKKTNTSLNEYFKKIQELLLEIKEHVGDRDSVDFPVEKFKKLISLYNNIKYEVQDIDISQEYYESIINCGDYSLLFSQIFEEIDICKKNRDRLCSNYRRFSEKIKEIQDAE